MTIDGFPGRKSYGTKGKPITLRTNYFHLQLAHDVDEKIIEKPLYRYTVDYADNEMPKPKKRRAIEQILQMPAFQKLTHATDFAATIVTTGKLDDAILNKTDLEIVLPIKGSDTVLEAPANDAPEHVKKARARNTVKFKITSGGSFNLHDLTAFISSTSPQAHLGSYGNFVQMLNIIMCKAPNEANAVAKLPGNKFYPHGGLLGEGGHPGVDSLDLAGGLVALRGYYSSVRCATGRILLNLNVTAGAFYHSVPLLDLASRFGSRDHEQWEMFVRKLKVKYHRPGKEPVTSEKTIIGLAKPLAPRGKPKVVVKRFGNAHEVSFQWQEQTPGPLVKQHNSSVFEYFKAKGYALKQPNLPVLNVGSPADPIYIPAELCTVLPGQPYRKFLSGDQTTKMLKFAARVPNQNAMSIAGDANTSGVGLRLLHLQGATDIQSRSMEPFGLKASTSMLTVEGRILTAPDVLYGRKKVTPFNGSWNCAGQAFAKGGSFAGWVSCVLSIAGRSAMFPDHPRNVTLIQQLAVELKKYGLSMGTNYGTLQKDLQNLTMANRERNNLALKGLFEGAKQRNCPLIFIVLPNDDKWLYARIKYYGDVEYGIHTICSIGSKLSKEYGQGMYMGNLALKFNLKGGGVNQEVANTLLSPLDKNTMVMGIDVTHPSPGSAKGAPSIASAVASRDSRLAQWPGSIRKQTGKQEMIDQKKAEFGDCVSDAILQEMVVERLECWRKFNNRQLPNKILLYRDGVSEGQYALVLRQELPHFEAAFAKLYGPQKSWPKMAVVVVGKRHHTRFYATKQEDADYNAQKQRGSWNTKPGTVVDRGITGNTYHELFLQAHQGLQGTARPAHYVVIKDQIGMDANCLEQVTLNLCHLFGRAPKAVSYAPPAYYADILATRGRAYLFNTLQEDHGADSTTGANDDAEWNGKVHDNLKDSMFYL
jgi:eukaryotic translation initiation factor 2C